MGQPSWTVPPPQRVVFCSNCGTLLEEPTFANTNVLCRMCGTVTPSKVFEELVVRSESNEKDILDEQADAAANVVQQKKARAVAKEKCPACGHPEMEYFTMQLRSADEGQTVFYECAKCGHTFSTNT
eukprot:CAMPEP_0119061470 /NCGR_PEP_ID=MMETSP1178-20130426/5248_1 /TAXON_ID=33656 /ORGANISM="unid sp, Strain CCMP2000" /LENGTH=126 /DNA_ID=CAMNT_0007042677 /DNA_START=50 /DNA_END=430 /DNA_ORIENTATION=+